jgi:hypothetical protein
VGFSVPLGERFSFDGAVVSGDMVNSDGLCGYLVRTSLGGSRGYH